MSVLGYVPEQTEINERYIATKKIEKWLRGGKTAQEIALLWNQGNLGKCSSGVNRHGVKYDSCRYVEVVLAIYAEQ